MMPLHQFPAIAALVPKVHLLTVAGLLLVVIAYVIYQVYFNPLAKYPGPIVARFIKMEVLHRTLSRSSGDVHLHILRCHLQYGPIVRYGPNVLLFNSVEGLKDIYVHSKNIIKDDCYEVLHIGARSILTATDPKDHGRRAKALRPAFTSAAIRKVEPQIHEHAIRLLTALHVASGAPENEPWGRPLLFSDWCSYATLDVITDLVFGRSSDLLVQPGRRHVVTDIEGMLRHAAFLMHAPLALLGRLDKWLFRDEVRGTRRYRELVKRMMREAGPNEVYSELAGSRGQDCRSASLDAEICSEVALLVVAGSDTISAVLCAVFFYLATYRTAYDRLRSEIRGAFHSLHEIRSGPVLQSCTYLDACLKEAMRISPGVSSALYRKVTKGGAVIAGQRVPAGCSVATGVYSLHHDPRYFLRPGVFVPERWRPGDKGEGAGEGESGGVTVAGGSGGASAYVPFSLGSRACLGRALALTELRILTAAIVWRFDFRFPPSDDASIGGGHPLGREGRTSPVEFQLRDYIVSHKKGPVLQLRPRRLS